MIDELERARESLSIYDGLVRVLEDPHGLLDLLLSAQNPQAASEQVQQRFGLDALQATAVLDLQFRRVTVLDRARIVESRQEQADYVNSLGGGSE